MSEVDVRSTLAGYPSKLNVAPGDTLDFMVHASNGVAYEADLVRFIHADLHRKGPGLLLEEQPAAFAGTHPGVAQDVRSGSFLRAELAVEEPADALTFAVAVFPTLYLARDQTLAELCGADGEALACLQLGGRARLQLDIAGQRIELDRTLPLHRWSFVGFCVDRSKGRASLFQSPQPEGAADGAAAHEDLKSILLDALRELRCASLTLASRHEDPARPRDTWSGRMDSPRLVATCLMPPAAEALVRAEQPEPDTAALLGFWDFSLDMAGREIRDRGPRQAHAAIHNLPTRAVRGFRWTGSERDWRRAPAEYGAIHFHESDVYDMGWPASFSFTVPEDLRSGVYAARLRRGDQTAYVTFFVGPPRTAQRKRPKIAFVVPTASYLAYSNELIYLCGPKMLYEIDFEVLPESQAHVDNPEFGASQYESHTDGSGIHFASWLRPIWNLAPNGRRVWGLPADSSVILWLETRGFEYDVITDHDIQQQGADLLRQYSVLITGSHPEYLTSEMYDAWEAFLAGGGRLMYLGGNGFYWRIAMNESWPAATELRRAEDGTRAWVEEAGEYRHAFDGEVGGLWRRQGRAPNRLVGVGFVAQGFRGSAPYRRTPAGRDPRAEFLFDGVEGDVIGDFGTRGRGAAGEEIDRYDPALGSPTHALVVATADAMSPDYVLAKEEQLLAMPGDSPGNLEGVRADMLFFETPAGGAVFSTGSIAWAGSLAHEKYENPVARISENVLRRFIDPARFEMPPPAEPEVPSKPTSRVTGARVSS